MAASVRDCSSTSFVGILMLMIRPPPKNVANFPTEATCWFLVAHWKAIKADLEQEKKLTVNSICHCKVSSDNKKLSLILLLFVLYSIRNSFQEKVKQITHHR